MTQFLTSLDILDTGFLTKAKTGTQLSSGNRVNSGNALRLKGVEFKITSSSNLDKTPVPSKFSQGAVPLISINPREFTIRIMLNSENTDTSNQWGINDMGLVAELIRLPETKGVKALYYPVDTAASGDLRGRARQLVYQLGSKDTTQPQGDIDITLWDGSASAGSKDLTDVEYLAVRFESCEMPQRTDNVIEIVLTGVITT